MTTQLDLIWKDFHARKKELRYDKAGIYLLYDDKGKQIYIGESMDINGRIDKHLKSNKELRKKFDRVEYIEMPKSTKKERLLKEIELIECVKVFLPEYVITNKGV